MRPGKIFVSILNFFVLCSHNLLIVLNFFVELILKQHNMQQHQQQRKFYYLYIHLKILL